MIDAKILETLFATIQLRKNADPSSSYTASLLADAPQMPARKLSEEATELVIEAIRNDHGAMVRESADLLYHLLVLWAAADIDPDAVWQELARRQKQSGLEEKAGRN